MAAGGLPPAPEAPEEGLDAIKASAPQPHSEERDVTQPLGDDDPAIGTDSRGDLGLPPAFAGLSPEIQNALTTLYGADFPLLDANASSPEWVRWVQNTWDNLGPGVQRRLHLVQRNRLYRQGIQWISSQGFGPWRAPPRSRDEVRVVENLIAPALNQRVQILTEQRPGFRVRPTTGDPDDLKRAESKQIALEYQYDQQHMTDVIREAAYWAGTDGVTFLELYWNPDGGPWHEAAPYQQDQQSAPLGQTLGQPQQPMAPPMAGGGQMPASPAAPAVPGVSPQMAAPPGAPQQIFPTPGAPPPMGMPMGGAPPPQQPPSGQPPGPQGDVAARVRRIEQVRVSANASATQKPWLWIIRDVMSKAEAVRVYGVDVASEMMAGTDVTDNLFSNSAMLRSGFQLPNIDELLLEQDKINRYTLYCDKSMALPKGLSMIVVGQKIVFQGPLLCGVIPMVRWADGSTDPAFYPNAEMDYWTDSQQRINTIKSKWVENIRLNSGAKMMAKENAISPESYTAANMSIISVKGLGSINEIAKPLDNFSVGADAKEALALERKQFEDLSGWNDATRGSFSTDQSGRAILAIREQVERIFSPMVTAATRAMTDWARVTCAWMAWGYDYPRDMGIEGKGRPDLARALKADDFDGVTDIEIDPETLMPMPRALRLFLLKDMYGQGLMGAQEYRRRMPFAWTRNIASPDEDQESRANRVCEALRQGQWLPILWQDNEAIHQDVLERQLILPDDTPPYVRQLAEQRWVQLANQSQMKMGIIPPGAPPAGGAPGGGGGGGPAKSGTASGLSPQEQPFASTNPGVAAQSAGLSDQDRAASQFESRQKSMEH